MKTVLIKYKDSKGIVRLLRADSCSGVSYGGGPYYCCFYLKGKKIAEILEGKLLPGYIEVYKKLFGRPWREELKNFESIQLFEYDDIDNSRVNPAAENETAYRINHDPDMYVIRRKNSCTLHVLNNEPITRRGDYKTALKKLFPGKPISIFRMVQVEEKL